MIVHVASDAVAPTLVGGIVALSAFCVAFAATAAATRMRWPAVLLVGWAAYGGVAACGSLWDAPPVAGLATALVALLLVLTPFPTAGSVLAAFTLAHDGRMASVAMLRGFVMALPGFAVFFFVVAVALG